MLPQIFVVPPGLPVSTMAEFVDWARARPGRLAFGSSGNAGGAHLGGTLFLRETGLDISHVPYRGGSAVLPDLISGTVVFAFATVNSATQLILDGRLKALAVASGQRVASLPAVPTMAEAGYPAVVLDEWNLLVCPGRHPGGGAGAAACRRPPCAGPADGARPLRRDRRHHRRQPAGGGGALSSRRQRDRLGRLVAEAAISIE